MHPSATRCTLCSSKAPTRTMTDTPDPTRCPLCGQRNSCSQADPDADGTLCWCFQTRIDPAALARVPPQLLDRACLCPRCAQSLPPDDESA